MTSTETSATSQAIGATVSALIPLLVTLIGGVVASRRATRPDARIEAWVRWWLIGLAFGSLAVVITFWLIPRTMATDIGYLHTPFQFETAGADLATLVGCVIAMRLPSWRIPVAVLSLVFLWNAALGHIYQALINGNHQWANTYGVCITDIVLPAGLLLTLLAQRRHQARTVG